MLLAYSSTVHLHGLHVRTHTQCNRSVHTASVSINFKQTGSGSKLRHYHCCFRTAQQVSNSIASNERICEGQSVLYAQHDVAPYTQLKQLVHNEFALFGAPHRPLSLWKDITVY
jgi:hypothetical protein